MEPGEAHRRSIGRRTDASDGDRMESSGPEFFQRVASTYEALAEEEPDRIVRIDGTAPVAEIAVRIWNDVERNRPPIDR
jgi:dTMP kinase